MVGGPRPVGLCLRRDIGGSDREVHTRNPRGTFLFFGEGSSVMSEPSHADNDSDGHDPPPLSLTSLCDRRRTLVGRTYRASIDTDALAFIDPSPFSSQRRRHLRRSDVRLSVRRSMTSESRRRAWTGPFPSVLPRPIERVGPPSPRTTTRVPSRPVRHPRLESGGDR